MSVSLSYWWCTKVNVIRPIVIHPESWLLCKWFSSVWNWKKDLILWSWFEIPCMSLCCITSVYLHSRTPLIRPPSESHWCGRIKGMVAREGFVYEQKPLSATRNVVVWEGWSLVRVVVRQGLYCITICINYVFLENWHLPCNTNNIEPYSFITFFPKIFDTPPPTVLHNTWVAPSSCLRHNISCVLTT